MTVQNIILANRDFYTWKLEFYIEALFLWTWLLSETIVLCVIIYSFRRHTWPVRDTVPARPADLHQVRLPIIKK